LETAKTKRIALQVEPDGRQPLELVRTKAWGYSVGNLDGLMLLAELGDRVGVDLWHYETRDGRSIRKALEFLAPFAFGDAKWAYQQLGEWPPQMLFPLIRRAAAHYDDAKSKGLIERVPAVSADDRSNFFLPQRRSGATG
jgi:predicted component of type VI protein secretion system